MNVNFRLQKLTLLILLLLIVTLIGCHKQRASWSLKSAKEKVEESKKLNAEIHQKDALTRAEATITEAETRLRSKLYKDALATAKQAVDQAKTLLEDTKKAEATAQYRSFEEWLKVAEKNNLRMENAEKYEEIFKIRDKADKARIKEKWLKSIELSKKGIEEIVNLAARLKSEAEGGLNVVQQQFQEAIGENIDKYAPRHKIEIEEYIKNIKENIEVNKDYRNANRTNEIAKRKIEEARIEIKRVKSVERIQEAENNLVKAIEKGAEEFAPDLYERASTSFNEVLQNFQNRKYDIVLQTMDLLEPQIVELIKITEIRRAKDRLTKVEKGTNNLKEGKVRVYLPGRIEKVDEIYAQALEEFNKENYELTEEICATAIDELNKIKKDFSTLADNYIKEAQNALELTEKVQYNIENLEKLTDTPDAERSPYKYIYNKGYLYVVAILNNAKDTLIAAKFRKEEGETDPTGYADAIELAKNAKETAQNAEIETYNVISRTGIIALEEEIAHYIKQGAAEFTPDELAISQKLLEEAKSIYTEKRYKDAVNKTADAKAQIENMKQAMYKFATNKIEETKKAIQEAKDVNADVYQKNDFDRSRDLLASAEDNLTKDETLLSVQQSRAAIEIATVATLESKKIQADEQLKKAADILAQAQKSGSQVYALDEYQKAENLIESSKKEFLNKNYDEALKLAKEGERISALAKNRNIIEAEKTIENAKYYDAWKKSPDTFVDSLISLDEAKKLMETQTLQGYQEAWIKAVAANKKAKSAELTAKEKNVAERLKELDTKLTNAQQSGAAYYQHSECNKINKEINDFIAEFNMNNYDEEIKKLNDIEAEITNVQNSIESIANELISAQNKKSEILVKDRVEEYAKAELDKGRDFLKYASIDFKNKKYRQSWENYAEGKKYVDKAETKRDEKIYKDETYTLLSELNDLFKKFSQILDMYPDTLKRLVIDENGKGQFKAILGGVGPIKFKDETSRLYLEARKIKPPASLESINKEFNMAFNLARLSGQKFQSLYMAEDLNDNTIRKIIDEGHKYYLDAKNSMDNFYGFFEKDTSELVTADK